jgi:uncharacterized protein (DUF1800 family)
MRSVSRILAPALSLVLLAGVTSSTPRLSERQRALHALNRLGFGARPGDVDRVASIGVDAWIDQQLHPERIADRALDARLDRYQTLKLSERDIVSTYYAPVLEARKEKKREAAAGGNAQMDAGEPSKDRKEEMRELRRSIPPEKRPGRVMEELVAQRIIRAAESDRQLNEVMVDFWFNHFNIYANKGVDRFLLTSYERDVIRPHIWGRFEDLLLATAKSPAMLFYLDNARSVADPEHRPQPGLNRAEGGRRGFFGRRRGLNADDAPMRATERAARQAKGNQKGGLNENYAREIMELHTLGVDGGYSQQDVTELARVFTGWTIDRPQQGGSGFIFRPNLHDAGSKTVLGVRLRAGGGMEEGERMIHLLAHHPSTAHHLAYQLCQRLVADDPPKALVDRVAKRFLDSDGDLRETVKAVIESPELWDAQTYRAKVKSPFEYAVSAIRAVGAHVDDPAPLGRELQKMGEPLYGAQPPTGYSDRAETWVNTGALMNRLNFALALASNKMPGIRSDVGALIPGDQPVDPGHSVEALALVLTGGDLTMETRRTISQRLEAAKAPPQDPGANTQLPMIAGLILGSPEFQKQ